MHRTRRRPLLSLTAGLALASLLTGCGTQLEGDSLAAARGEGRAGGAVSGGAQDGSGTGTSDATGSTTGGVDDTGAAGDPAGGTSGGSTGAGGTTGGTGGGTTGSGTGGSTGGGATGGSATGGSGAGGTGTGGGSTDGSTGGGTGGAAGTSGGSSTAAAKGSPIVVGSVGTYSGPSGTAWKPGTEGLKVWAKDVNARGGVDGHPVQVIVVDDGGDPARHLAAIKDLAESKKAFAFVYNDPSTSGSDATDAYLAKNGIPVIGGDLTYKTWDKNPMYFPNGTPQDDQILAHVTGAAKLRPTLKKFGSFTCREADGCTAARAAYPAKAKQAGLQPVFNAEVSIAQPDFTSECLGARNAGVQLLAVVVDPNSARRVVSSCARQNYKPTFIFVATVVSSGQNGDANVNGTIGVVSSSPYPSGGSPGQAAFQAAVKKYAPGLRLDQSTPLGYSAGVMFETAAKKGLGAVPSRAKLIENLYTFKGETLGGLAPPLTFVRGKKKSVPCFFVLEYKGQKWQEANGGKPLCP